MNQLANKVVVLTGGTSGIGQSAAEQLAAMGARIVQIARDPVRGQAALRRLQEINPGNPHSIHYADLLRLSEMKRVASEIAAAESRIDIFINNAGALFSSRGLTPDGFERTFALNHVAHFVLVNGLLDRLVSSAPSRIINTASDAHAAATLDFDDLQSEQAYRGNLFETLRYGGPGFKVYARSKLCNIFFTRELSKRLRGTGVTANCVHPGFVATRFGDQSGGFLSFAIGIAKRFALAPDEGAQTLVYLAASPEVTEVTGQYFHNKKAVPPSAAALDDAAAGRLWAETARLAQLSPAL